MIGNDAAAVPTQSPANDEWRTTVTTKTKRRRHHRLVSHHISVLPLPCLPCPSFSPSMPSPTCRSLHAHLARQKLYCFSQPGLEEPIVLDYCPFVMMDDDEQLMSIDQPLALWSPSFDPSHYHQQQQQLHDSHFGQQPGCSTPLASPPHPKSMDNTAHAVQSPYAMQYHQLGQPPFDPHLAQQQQQQQPPFAPMAPLALLPEQQNWPSHQHQQPAYCIPPPPPYFEQFPRPYQQQQQQEMMVHSPMFRQAVSGRPGSSLATGNCQQRIAHLPPQQQQQREQRRCAASQHKVQQWQQFGTGQMPLLQDSGVHSMSQSTATSAMSLSSVHPVSCLSGVSSLPDEFPGLQEHPFFQHMPTNMRHEEPEKMRKVLPELVPLINDESEEIALRALTILGSIARKDKELTLGKDGPLIGEKRVVEELLRTLWTHKKNKKVVCYALRALHFISDNEPSGRELFVQTLNTHGTGCLEELVHCIGIQEHSCFKYAFLVLHNLMSDPRIGRKVIAYMCEMRILTKVLGWLGDKNEKFLNIVTDIVHMLVSRNSEQMAFFLGLNGHQRLIHILAHSQQETLLYRSVKLLNRVVQMDPERIVAAGLLESAQRHLGQASQRLIRQVLDCVRAASHVSSAGHEIQPLLQKLLQLLGSNDMRLKESCTDILANLSANNAQNKEFLVQSGGAVYALFQLLHELDALQEALGPSAQREGIQERALALLRALCAGNSRASMAKRQVLAKDGHKRLLLQRLRQQRLSGGGSEMSMTIKRTLMLVQQLVQEEEELPSMRFAVSFPPPPFVPLPDAPLAQPAGGETCSFASQTVLILHQAMLTLLGSANSQQQQQAAAKENSDICQRCLDILRAMARDVQLRDEIFAELRARRIRLRERSQSRLMVPQLMLCFYDQFAPNAVALMAELARIPEAATLLRRDQPTLDALQRWTNSGVMPTAQFALQTLQLVHEPQRQQPTVGQNGNEGSQHQSQPFGEGSGFEHHQTQAQFGHQLPQYPPPFGGEESAALNNSPTARMDFSPATALHYAKNTNNNISNGFSSSHPSSQHHHHPIPHGAAPSSSHAPMPNGGEQLAEAGTFFPDFHQQQQQPANVANQSILSYPIFPVDDFGPFVSALCPSPPSPAWAPQH